MSQICYKSPLQSFETKVYFYQDGDHIYVNLGFLCPAIIFEILSYLNASDIAHLSRVNKDFYHWLQDDTVFRLLCLRKEHLGLNDSTIQSHGCWKRAYLSNLIGFSWNTEDKNRFISVTNRNKSIRMTGPFDRWVGIKTKPLPKQGVHRLYVKMESCSDGGHCYIGVSKEDFDVVDRQERSMVTKSIGRWTYASNGAVGVNGNWIYSERYSSPCVVTVVVDMERRKVSFLLNGRAPTIHRAGQVMGYSEGNPVTLNLEPSGEICFIAAAYFRHETMSIISEYEAAQYIGRSVLHKETTM